MKTTAKLISGSFISWITGLRHTEPLDISSIKYLKIRFENIFNDINHAIFNEEHVDLQHLYIDGSKFEANANKYTWVWKKATEKFRYKLYEKSLRRLRKLMREIAWSGVQITTNTEYVPDYLNEIVEQLVLLWELDTSTFVYGSGKRKSKRTASL